MAAGRRRIPPGRALLFGFLALLLLAGVDLTMQEVYHRYLRPPTPLPPSPTPTLSPSPSPSPTRTPAPSPTALPTASPLPSPTLTLTQTLTPTPLSFPDRQMQEAIQEVTFRQLLLKAAIELLRAEDYLASGEMKQVERELVAVEATLDQAALFADDSLQSTMDDLQRDLSHLREDLYLRPERLREGIRRLWQRIDVLIGP